MTIDIVNFDLTINSIFVKANSFLLEKYFKDFQEIDTSYKTDLLEKLKNTTPIAEVKMENYDAVFYPGGHGPLWDLAESETSQKLIVDFYNANKPIAFVCHAPGVLRHVKAADGQPLVAGKKVAGFTNTEEEGVGLTDVVPFLVEDELKKLGGVYSKGPDWGSYVVQDGLLITGQNPGSSEAAAALLLKQLA